jgi:hypothetical protein
MVEMPDPEGALRTERDADLAALEAQRNAAQDASQDEPRP